MIKYPIHILPIARAISIENISGLTTVLYLYLYKHNKRQFVYNGLCTKCALIYWISY